MFRFFTGIAFRYLWQNKTYSILNYVCLAFGFTCAIVSVLYVRNALSYNKFNENYERLYSVEAMVTFFNGDRFPKQYLTASLPDMLRKNAPEIEDISRVSEHSGSFINGDKNFTLSGIYADENFFRLFTFPFIRGEFASEGHRADINSISISEKMAVLFFGTNECVGKTLTLKENGTEQLFKINGVFSNVPSQSSIRFDFVIPFTRYLADNPQALETGATSNETWILLNGTTNKMQVQEKIKNLITNLETSMNQELFLFPLKDKNLYRYTGHGRVWGDMQWVVIVAAVGFVILLIACFNFINMAVALNIKRYRETGIKKVIGSKKKTIIGQFMGETFIIAFAALLTAVFLVYLVLPVINSILGYGIHFRVLSFEMTGILLAIVLFTCLVAGLFPALYLASSSPLTVLKGGKISGRSYSFLRQAMIIFQFTIPVALIVCVMIIKVQDSFMRNYDIGVDKNRLIVLNNSEALQKHSQSFKNDLLKLPGIVAVSFSNCLPARGTRISNEVSWEGKKDTEKLHFWCVSTDYDYNKAVTVHLTEGRFFDATYPSDSTCYVINDIAVDVMKMKNPAGSTITLDGRRGTVIGVFDKFHAVDLAGPYAPVIIRIDRESKPFILIRYSSGNYADMSGKVKKVFSTYCPDQPFEATLYRNLPSYSNLALPANLTTAAFIIALLLACMGLYGLASFTSESRTKEIGIRKTNGATTISVMRMLLSNYMKWLVISFVIAAPIAYFLGSFFLGRFHFRTPFPFWVFIAGPAVAFTVAIFTVSTLTWRVANRNPVEALRYE
ncbi:MAG TPA: ABC transporter permease [Bacteroidales bacterium]|nr:ABC transporter permease [Bacteroidales bacterium]